MKLTSLILTVSIFLVSCSSVKVNSNKLENYDRKPTRVLIYANTPKTLQNFNQGLTDILASELLLRGVTTSILFKTPVSLPDEYEKSVRSFSPNAVLIIAPTMLDANYREATAGNFEITLQDLALNKEVWKSSIDIYTNTTLSDAIRKGARMIIKKMEDDQIVSKATGNSGS